MNTDDVCEGRRVRLLFRVDRFPDFSVPAGSVGTIVEVTPGMVSVQMDDAIPGAEQWENCLHFYDATTFGPNQEPDGWDHFADTVELIDQVGEQ